MKPSLSIVLPTYNRHALLHGWLASVLDQPVAPDQIVIVDDCSKDFTASIVKLFLPDDRIVYLRNPTNLGVARSNLVGLDKVSSSHVLFAADDDRLRPNAVAILKRTIEEFPNDCLIAGRSMWHNPRKRITWVSGRSLEPGRYWPTDTSNEASNGNLRIPGESSAYNVELIRRHNAYRPEIQLYADLYMMWYLVFQYPFTIVPDVLTDFYLNPEGNFARNKDKNEQDIQMIIRMFEANLKPEILLRIQESGIIGFADADPELIEKVYPAWSTMRFRGHCLLRKFERLTHRWVPGWVIRLFGRFYR